MMKLNISDMRGVSITLKLSSCSVKPGLHGALQAYVQIYIASCVLSKGRENFPSSPVILVLRG